MSWVILGPRQLEGLRKGVVKLGPDDAGRDAVDAAAPPVHSGLMPAAFMIGNSRAFLSIAECLDLGRRGRPGRGAKIVVARG